MTRIAQHQNRADGGEYHEREEEEEEEEEKKQGERERERDSERERERHIAPKRPLRGCCPK